ncbi:MAG: hypothetical protein ABJM06_06450 [Gilvibacter sp.]
MKKLLIIASFFICQLVAAQVNAVTDTGDTVVLYDDGTWKYLDDSVRADREIKTNPASFSTPSESTFMLKSKGTPYGFNLNPKKWSFQKSAENDEAEFELVLKGEDLYGMILTEKVEIPLESLRELAIENARLAAPDIYVVTEEYRMVNGKKVLFLQMNGTLQGIKFSYYGYYYSNVHGTVQYITYTSQNLLSEYRPYCDDLLNGLVTLEE